MSRKAMGCTPDFPSRGTKPVKVGYPIEPHRTSFQEAVQSVLSSKVLDGIRPKSSQPVDDREQAECPQAAPALGNPSSLNRCEGGGTLPREGRRSHS